jgi:(S)-mandelate dehydrogenase
VSVAVLDGTPHRHFYAGRNAERATTIGDLRAMAHRRLPGFALEYLEGGAEEESTLARNRAALAAWRFAPHALQDVSKRDASIELFGRRARLPFAIAPTGLNGLFGYRADRLLAEAAAAAGIPFAQSTMSNVTIEEIAQVRGLRHWFQLYVFGEPRVHETLIARARDAGCEALIVTVDAQTYGDREWNRRWFTRPGHPSWRAYADALLHPHWIAATLAHGMPRFENIVEFVPPTRRRFFESAFWVRSKMTRALDWNTIAQVRRLWPRKLLVKGLLRAGDVRQAAAVGADGAILSNHGGRQLDWAVAGLDALLEARAAVGEHYLLIVDGGIRRGTDVLKLLALGADAALAGRALLYGVAAAGREGAARAIDILATEIDRDLALLGVPRVTDLDASVLVRVE